MKNYPRCKTCKRWMRNTFSEPLLPHLVGLVQFPCEHPKTKAAESGRMRGGEVPDGKIADGALPTELYGLLTGPDFGCVHHERKEPE